MNEEIRTVDEMLNALEGLCDKKSISMLHAKCAYDEMILKPDMDTVKGSKKVYLS